MGKKFKFFLKKNPMLHGQSYQNNSISFYIENHFNSFVDVLSLQSFRIYDFAVCNWCNETSIVYFPLLEHTPLHCWICHSENTLAYKLSNRRLTIFNLEKINFQVKNWD